PLRKDKPPLILIIDEDKEAVRLMREYLHEEGFRTSCAFDGIRGVVHAIHDNPDLIILELVLPRISGYEVIKRLQVVSKRTKEIPVMILTKKNVSEGEKRQLVELEPNVIDFVPKPIARDSFIVKIHRVLGTGVSEKEIMKKYVEERRHETHDGEVIGEE
ncbi:MAG: hypothetical protein DRI22_00045, partial [Caldiserica bacterium]